MASFTKEVQFYAHAFSKILFDVDSIKKIDKVYDKYQIPSGEVILAYIKSTVPLMGLTMDGTVLTNEALYIHPSHTDWAPTNRFPFSELCQYLLFQPDEKGAVTLRNSREEFTISGTTLFSRNIAGAELRQMLCGIQQLLRQYSWAVQQRDDMANQIFATAKGEMRTNSIQQSTMALLDAIEQEEQYAEMSACIKAENIFRTCNAADYQSYLAQLSEQVQQSIKHRKAEYRERLLQDLSDKALDMDAGFLNAAYGNLARAAQLAAGDYSILAYICARLGKTEQLRLAIEQVRKTHGEAQAHRVEAFKNQYYNQRMLKVYHAIQDGGVCFAEWLDWADNFGLTPLHYALILQQPECVEHLLKQKQWKINNNGDSNLSDVYDYVTVACALDADAKEAIFQNCTNLLNPLLRSRKAIERQIKVKEAKLILLKATERKAKDLAHLARKNNMYDKMVEMREKADMQHELRMQTMEELDWLQSELSEIDSEIHAVIDDAMIVAMDAVYRMQNSQDPFVKCLFHIYTDKNFLLHILSDCQTSYRLYTYQGMQFITPVDVDLDLPYQEYYQNQERHEERQQNTQHSQNTDYRDQGHAQTQNEKNSAGSIKKPYGTSWFSPEAHRDMKKLREEYRKLAKQYHPDRCRNYRSQEIFQDILNERANILENMN